ncbi:MAG: hypothetical protein Q8P78_00115 [bacterium]|nr:hypothetical protein [bacterium]
MVHAFKTVFANSRYAVLAFTVSLALFVFVAWLPNLQLLAFALASDTLSFWRLVWQTPRFFAVNTTFFTAAVTATVIVFSGINIAMLAYYLKRRIKTQRAAGVGIAGTLVGLLGVGCAACGSVILSSIFGLSAATGFLGFFPFNGVELGVIGAAALALSIRLLAKKIQNPDVCAIKSNTP